MLPNSIWTVSRNTPRTIQYSQAWNSPHASPGRSLQVTPAELHTLLDPAGFVWDIHIPVSPDGRSKGFAFASFTCHPHAQRAIEVANGQTLRKRLVAADWAVGKGAFEKVKEAAVGAVGVDSGRDGGSDGEAGSDGDGGGSDDDMDQDDGSDDDMAHGLGSDDGSGSEEEDEGEEGADGAAEGMEPEVAKEQQMLHSVLDQVLSKQERQQQQEERKRTAQQQPKQEQQTQQGQQQAKAADGSKDAAAAAAAAGAHTASAGGADGAPSTSAPAPFGERSNTVFVRGLLLDVTSQELQVRGIFSVVVWRVIVLVCRLFL